AVSRFAVGENPRASGPAIKLVDLVVLVAAPAHRVDHVAGAGYEDAPRDRLLGERDLFAASAGEGDKAELRGLGEPGRDEDRAVGGEVLERRAAGALVLGEALGQLLRDRGHAFRVDRRRHSGGCGSRGGRGRRRRLRRLDSAAPEEENGDRGSLHGGRFYQML